jgi:hypothetical protein
MEKSLMGWAIEGATVFNCERGGNGGRAAFPCRDLGNHHRPGKPSSPHKKRGPFKERPQV